MTHRGPRAHNLVSTALFALIGACSAELGGTGEGSALDEAGVPDGSALDAGPRADGGAGADVGAPPNCDGLPSGTVQTQPGYREPLVAPTALCEAGLQKRTCVDGAWSAFTGDFPYPGCAVQGYDSCDGEPHGAVQTRSVYSASVAASAGACAAARTDLSRTCTDGVWGAWSPAPAGSVETCSIAVGGGCASTGELASYGCAAGTCNGARCALPNGATCSQDIECAGTCLAGVCGPLPSLFGACDDNDDCSAAAACTRGAQCSAGACLCNDVSVCTDNSQCANTCRANFCAPRSTSCDANDQADCTGDDPCYLYRGAWICVADRGVYCESDNNCQVTCVSNTCALPSGLYGACDDDVDCTTGMKCASASGSLKLCLLGPNQPCNADEQCASTSCSVSGGGIGVCQ